MGTAVTSYEYFDLLEQRRRLVRLIFESEDLQRWCPDNKELAQGARDARAMVESYDDVLFGDGPPQKAITNEPPRRD